MKKLLAVAMMITMMISCKKEDAVKPCPAPVTPQYSETDYYLTNPSGRGEADTIRFNFQTMDHFFLTSSLVAAIHEPSNVDIEGGVALTVHYHLNAAGTKFTDGSGTFGNNELMIYWREANSDTTGVVTFYSVYSKVRIN